MQNHLVTCIVKPDVKSRHEHITHIGSYAEGVLWTRSEAIEMIDSRRHKFTVTMGGETSTVGVVRPSDGRVVHLRTYADGEWKDNLLSLPQCNVR